MISIAAGFVGVLFGFLTAVTGYYNPNPKAALEENIRWKNVVYAVFGQAVVFSALLIGEDQLALDINLMDVVPHYLIFASGMTIATIFVVAVLIYQAEQKDWKGVKAVLRYLHLGQLDNGHADASPALVQRIADLEKSELELQAEIDQLDGYLDQLEADEETSEVVLKNVANSMQATLASFKNPDAHSNAIREILNQLVDAVETLANANPSVNANYLEAFPYEQCDPEYLGWLRFPACHHGKIDHVLVLKAYADYGGSETKFALPVHADEDEVLPGGPLCFRKRLPTIVDCTSDDRLKWRSGVSEACRAEIRKYLTAKQFNVFVSLPILVEIGSDGNNYLVGVLTIEAGDPNFLGELNDEQLAKLTRIVNPFALMIGWILKESKE